MMELDSNLTDEEKRLGIFLDYFSDTYFSNDSDYCCEEGDICDLNESASFEAVFIPVLYSMAFVVGVLGNGVLLAVLFQSRRAWSVTDTFILHLGLADVLLLVTLPLWAVQFAQGNGWELGTPLCKITGTVYTINFYCGIFLLACISLDRYLSIVHATQMYSRRKSWVVHVSCFVVWFFSLLLSIPDWIFTDVTFNIRQNRNYCVRDYSKVNTDAIEGWQLASRLLYHIIGFLLPSAVLIFCYSRILHRLRGGSQGLQKQRAFKVIISLVVVFFLCWTPYNITLIVDTFNQNNSTTTCGTRTNLAKAKTVTFSLGYLHCSLNPVLYAFVGVKFRRKLLDILGSLGCKIKSNVNFQSVLSTKRSSIWSDSIDTSNSVAV